MGKNTRKSRKTGEIIRAKGKYNLLFRMIKKAKCKNDGLSEAALMTCFDWCYYIYVKAKKCLVDFWIKMW